MERRESPSRWRSGYPKLSVRAPKPGSGCRPRMILRGRGAGHATSRFGRSRPPEERFHFRDRHRCPHFRTLIRLQTKGPQDAGPGRCFRLLASKRVQRAGRTISHLPRCPRITVLRFNTDWNKASQASPECAKTILGGAVPGWVVLARSPRLLAKDAAQTEYQRG